MFSQVLIDSMSNKTVISVFVTEEVKEKLKTLAEKEKRSMSQMASVLIDEALDERSKKK